MSKSQDVLDKVLPAVGVVISGDFLREPVVTAFLEVLKYREYPSGKKHATVMKEIESCTNYAIWCSLTDDQLPLGPTLTIRGDGSPGKITVPWNQIITIVQLHEPITLPKMGFIASK